jgi:hypothetical protein
MSLYPKFGLVTVVVVSIIFLTYLPFRLLMMQMMQLLPGGSDARGGDGLATLAPRSHRDSGGTVDRGEN